MELFDAHCHLQLPQYEADQAEVIARMKERGVAAVVVGTDLATSTQAVELAEKYDFLWASVGLHPNDNIDEVFDDAAFLALAQHPRVVAIGECGLDYFRSGGTEEEKAAAQSGISVPLQKVRFEKQIALAVSVNKPLIIHCRNAHEDMLPMLAEHTAKNSGLRVIIHFFTGTRELAEKYLALGCYLSFPGPVTYTDMYDESIRVTPLDKLLVETDAPFAAPVPFRGKRNEPVYVEEVAKKVAALKNVPLEEVLGQILSNAQGVFNIEIV